MKARRSQWLFALVLLGALYLVYVWDRLVIAIELVEVRKALNLSLSDAGLLATVFTLGITIGAIPAGVFVSRFGARKALALGALVFSLCTGWTAVSPNWHVMLASRIGGGVGEALFNVALFTFLANYAGRFKGAAAGFPATVFGVGVFSGPLVISGLLGIAGIWTLPFFVLAVAGFAGAVAVWIIVPDADVPDVGADSQRTPLAAERLRGVVTPTHILLLLIVAVDGIAIYSFIALFQTFLREHQHLTIEKASLIASVFGIGQLCGGVPMGYVADRFGRRRYLAAAVIVTGMAGFAMFGESGAVAHAALAFIFGVGTNSIYTNCIAMAQEQVATSDIPIATGLLSTVYFFTAAFSGWILAVLKDILGWESAGMTLYAIPFFFLGVLISMSAYREFKRAHQIE